MFLDNDVKVKSTKNVYVDNQSLKDKIEKPKNNKKHMKTRDISNAAGLLVEGCV